MSSFVSTKKSYIDPQQLPPVERAMLRRIFSHLLPYRRSAAAILLCVVAGALLNLLPPLFVKEIVDYLEAVLDHAQPPEVGRLLLLCLGMVLGPLAAGLIGVGQKYLATQVGEKVMLDLRLQLYEHLNRQSVSYFVRARPGEALSSVLNDVQGVGAVMSGTLVTVVENLVTFSATAPAGSP